MNEFGVCYLCRGSLGFRDGEGPTVPLPCDTCSARGRVRMHYSCLADLVKRESDPVFPVRWDIGYGPFFYECPTCRGTAVLSVSYKRLDYQWKGWPKALRRTGKKLCRQAAGSVHDLFSIAFFYCAVFVPFMLAWAERWLYPLGDESIPCICATAALAPLELWMFGSAMTACGDKRNAELIGVGTGLRIIRLFGWRRLFAGFVLREVAWLLLVAVCVAAVSVSELGAKLSDRKRYWTITNVTHEK